MKPADSFLSQWPLSFKRLLSAKQIPVIKISGILFVLLSLFPYGSVRADRIVYSYDNSGNRILRQKEIVYRTRSVVDGESEDPEEYSDTLSVYNKVTVYPNPTEGLLKIDITGMERVGRSSLSAYSQSGQLLMNVSPLSDSNEIDLTGYPSAVYYFIIVLDDKTSTWKIIKK